MTDYKKPTCRGAWALGTACGHCEKCKYEMEKYANPHKQHKQRITELEKELERVAKYEKGVPPIFPPEKVKLEARISELEAQLEKANIAHKIDRGLIEVSILQNESLNARLEQAVNCLQTIRDIAKEEGGNEFSSAARIDITLTDLPQASERLREALKPFGTGDALEWAEGLFDDAQERYPITAQPQNTAFIDESGNASLKVDDFFKAREALKALEQKQEARMRDE